MELSYQQEIEDLINDIENIVNQAMIAKQSRLLMFSASLIPLFVVNMIKR